MSKEMYNETRKAITVAKDLGYGDDTIARIRNAKSVSEIDRILITARHNKEWY